tara:strand:- start:6436 stop:7830 length:1395 start_codon:yes stop_codon:yes gene_type:complete
LSSRKIFILLPDGVGLRSFAYSSFVEAGQKLGWEIIFWNQTPFDLKKLGYTEVKLRGKPRAFTDLVKRAKIQSELDFFTQEFNDPIYQTYKFSSSKNGVKSRIKNSVVSFLVAMNKGESGVRRLNKMLRNAEAGSSFYKSCKTVLEKEKPDLVFCTNQRPGNAIAPLLAARDLGIKTGCFIFSWDNLPKATKVIETDFYLVWSDYMQKELQTYYPYIKDEQIKVTGTPQFEVHFKKETRVSRESFFAAHDLVPGRQYVCFSGDDVTTSPHDEFYLRDVAEAVRQMNAKGGDLGVIFRRCPVDFSDRYDRFIKEYDDVIVAIEAVWKKQGNAWNSILPLPEDLILQSNIIQHTFMVINVGSSMVFDYVSYHKPCMYINYNPAGIDIEKDTRSIYDYVHFRSMPSKNAVLWGNAKEEISQNIQAVLEHKTEAVVEEAQNWFKRINKYPPQDSINRIWKALDSSLIS